MRYYESIVILRPSVTDAEVKTIADRIKDTIKKKDGDILTIEHWGRKKLAYEVKKEKKGYYIFYHFTALPEVITDLDHLYKVTDSIIKYITLNTGKPKPKPAEVPSDGLDESEKVDIENLSEEEESFE